YLVEFQCIKKIIQFPVLSNLLQFNVVLLETMKRQLRLIIDKDFQGLRGRMSKRRRTTWVTNIGHEFLASCPDLLGERRTKHHDLLVVRSSSKDFLNITAHV